MTDLCGRTPVTTSPTTTSEPIVTPEDISFFYGSSAVLTDVTGRVPAGQTLALVGSNGPGKTTPMRALFGMVTVSRGRVHANGTVPGRTPRGPVGYVPQLSGFDSTFPVTVREVVQMGIYSRLGILRRPGAETCRQVLEALGNVGLADHARWRFGTLSSSQQQRILMMRCVAVRPHLILLDEPFNGLDQPNREVLLSIITPLKDQGISLVIPTHSFVLVQEICEQAALLTGRQIVFGPHDDVLVARYVDEAYDGHDTTRLLGLCLGADTQEPLRARR